MNYYIKGEHPAKWVRAKLRELGVKETNILIPIICKAFYCVEGEDFECIVSDAVKATIKASPDWEEVRPTKPEPKFKVGEIVQYLGGFFQVMEVKERDRGFIYRIGDDWCYLEDLLTRPDNPTVRHKVKEAFSILNNKHCDIGAC